MTASHLSSQWSDWTTGWTNEEQHFPSWQGQDILSSKESRLLLNLPCLLLNRYQGLFPRDKEARGHRADLSPPCTAKVKQEQSCCISTPTYTFRHEDDFTFQFILNSKHWSTCVLTAYDKCTHTLKITLHEDVVLLTLPYHISFQDTSPCSQARNNPFYMGCCSPHPPSHVHRHTVL